MTNPQPQTTVATITRCRHSQPLIVLDGEPFNGLEIRPHELRHMAAQLNALATMAAQLPTAGKRFVPTKVSIGIHKETA